MRVRLVVSSLIAGSVLFASLALAQPAPGAPAVPPAKAPAPAATAPAAAAPAPAAPAAAPAAPPPAAAAAPVDAPVAATASEGFDLRDALRGPGAPLTSDEAAARAAKTAPSVARAEAAARKAALAAEQVNIALYPRLELEASYTLLSRVDAPPFSNAFAMAGMDNPFDTQQQHTGKLEARLSYPVSALFFTIIPRHKAALKSAEAQKLTSKVQAHSVALQAREAFYNYARTRAALMVAKSAQSQTEAHRRDVDALVNAGSLAKVELMRADAQVAAATVAVARTQVLVANARVGLFTLTHIEGNEDLTINEDFSTELPPLVDTSDSMLAKALANRSELRQLRMTLEAIEHTVDAAQGQELPQLVVGGLADYANPNQRWFGFNDVWKPSWAAFASVTWSPNDWANYDSVADQARADLAQTLADLESLEDALRIEVSTAYESYNAARAALVSARSGIAAAEESFRVRREQFRAGAAVATEVIDAEGDLRDARLDLVNALIELRIAKARLDRAVET
jgi:outer membrane protein